MFEFKVMAAISVTIVFISVFFIQFAFNNFIRIVELCSIEAIQNCDNYAISMLFVFSFSIVVSFIVVIETTIYYIFKEIEVKVIADFGGKKKMGSTLKELERRREDVKKSKRDVHKEYLNRKIEQNTYNDLKQKYDKDLFELEKEIEALRKKVS